MIDKQMTCPPGGWSTRHASVEELEVIKKIIKSALLPVFEAHDAILNVQPSIEQQLAQMALYDVWTALSKADSNAQITALNLARAIREGKTGDAS